MLRRGLGLLLLAWGIAIIPIGIYQMRTMVVPGSYLVVAIAVAIAFMVLGFWLAFKGGRKAPTNNYYYIGRRSLPPQLPQQTYVRRLRRR